MLEGARVNLHAEINLVTKLKALGVELGAIDYLSPFEDRLATVRAAVNQVPDITFTVRDGKNITLAQQFAAVYGVPA